MIRVSISALTLQSLRILDQSFDREDLSCTKIKKNPLRFCMNVSKSSFRDTSLYAFFNTLKDLENWGSIGFDSVGSTVSSLVKSLESLGGGNAATITSSSSFFSSSSFY